MALKLNFSSLSMGASVDQQTGNLSVFDVIEEVRIPQVPAHLQQMVISLCLEKTTPGEANGKVEIHVVTPDGQTQRVGNGELSMPETQKRMKAVFRFGGFPLRMFGDYRIVLAWTDPSGRKEGEAVFDFEVIQIQQVAQGVQPDSSEGNQGEEDSSGSGRTRYTH